MKELVFFLEEPSAAALLTVLMERLLGPESEIIPRYIVFEGKQDLHRQLARKLRGYLNPHARFIVLRDQDAGDCRLIKSQLKALCEEAGKPDAVVRIACRELEAFFLGDLNAVELATGVSRLHERQGAEKFRATDEIQQPARELKILVGEHYRKIAGARSIAAYLDLNRPGSRSFGHLLGAIRSAVQQLQIAEGIAPGD